jgi:sugar phosphate isomerase/epimerase
MKKLFLQVLPAFLMMLALTNCNDAPKEETEAGTGDSAATASTATTSVTDEWKLGVQLWTFNRFPFVEAISKADSAGIKYIEAFPGQKLGGNLKGAFGPDMPADIRDSVKKLLQSKGITLVAYGVVGGGPAELWKKTLEFAKDMGIQYVTAEPSKNLWGVIDSLAGVNGVKIAIHEHPRPNPYAHPDSVIAAMKGHPNIYACADLGHWARSGYDVVDCLKKLEGRIIGSHLKDVKEFNNPKAEDVIPGTGVIKFADVFAEFKRQGFKGMFSIERENNWNNNLPDVVQIKGFYNQQVSALK